MKPDLPNVRFHICLFFFFIPTIKSINKTNSSLRFERGLVLDERQSAAELDAVLQHHHNLQEKLAEDMLNLARNLKNNTLVAQNIIKQDNQVWKKTSSAEQFLY